MFGRYFGGELRRHDTTVTRLRYPTTQLNVNNEGPPHLSQTGEPASDASQRLRITNTTHDLPERPVCAPEGPRRRLVASQQPHQRCLRRRSCADHRACRSSQVAGTGVCEKRSVCANQSGTAIETYRPTFVNRIACHHLNEARQCGVGERDPYKALANDQTR